MNIDVKVADVPFGTSIQDIEVPDVLKKRIPPGLEYFDAIFIISIVSSQKSPPGSGVPVAGIRLESKPSTSKVI